jgi:ferredoxin
MRVRVEVDHDVCEANGLCELAAPGVFQLDEQDTLHVLRPEFPAELADGVHEAVDRCPKVALRLVEGG